MEALFDRLAGRYDLFNRIASLGLDRQWRQALVKVLLKHEPPAGIASLGARETLLRLGGSPPVPRTTSKKKVILDLGTGTGELIFEILSARNSTQRDLSFVGLDFSEAMLRKAGRKLQAINKNVHLIRANAGMIPLAHESVDILISAFALRNIKKIISEVLCEAQRVLRPGGALFFLEMVVPSAQVIKFLHKIYLRTALALVGKSIFGSRWCGNYLSETIANFWTPNEFSALLTKMNFKDVQFHPLTMGIAVVHMASKSASSLS